MLLDTSGLLSLIDKREPHQERAVELYNRATTRLTHNYILAELVALGNSRRVPREAVLEFSDRLLSDDEIELIWIDETLHKRALDLLFARLDKTYSLCDAVSFVLMRERGETEAVFAVAGKSVINEEFALGECLGPGFEIEMFRRRDPVEAAIGLCRRPHVAAAVGRGRRQ